MSSPNEYVEEVLLNVKYNPHPVWCLDIALDTNGKPYVLEVGSFSVSGLYDTDKEKIVDRVSEIAYEEFKLMNQ